MVNACRQYKHWVVMDGSGFLLCSNHDRYVLCAVNILSYIPTIVTTATVRKLDDQPGGAEPRSRLQINRKE